MQSDDYAFKFNFNRNNEYKANKRHFNKVPTKCKYGGICLSENPLFRIAIKNFNMSSKIISAIIKWKFQKFKLSRDAA